MGAMSENAANSLKSQTKIRDIWTDGLSKIFKKNNFYFVHPIYFLNHLDKARLFEFNPYAGMKYSDIYSGVSMPIIVGNNITESGDSVVVNNPGFAPVWVERNVRNPNIDGYACVTGFFNQDYLPIKSGDGYPYERRFNVFNHEGLDFRGGIGTEIKSFIYGKVIAYGTYETYGRTIFIRNKDCTGIFLLAHLSEFNKTILDSGNIAPGDVVGKVGTSGPIKKNEQGIEKIDGCYEAHLHISYFIINSSEETANSFVTYNGENSFGKKIEKGSTFKNGVLGNPLNYNSKRKDTVPKAKEEIELWDSTHK